LTGEGVQDLRREWPQSPPVISLREIFAPGEMAASKEPAAPTPPFALQPQDPVTIRYTSGTSGEPKGAILTRANVDAILARTTGRLDLVMKGIAEEERIFHYLPFCFAGSWILLWTALSRGALLTIASDPARLSEDLASTRPHTFLNVPLALERIRSGIEGKLRARGGAAGAIFQRAFAATLKRADHCAGRLDLIWLSLARTILFPTIRRKFGEDLRALICGSAPLSRETQLFFEMLGIPVLQVYGLTETTAICTMDHPDRALAGRVGEAIEGIEMQLSPEGEILVRGENIFAGYWNRPQETAEAFTGGWLRTGDLGDVDASGRWRITGRVKNVFVLTSGHNVAPEPLEEEIKRALPRARQVIVVGHARPHVGALLSGDFSQGEAAQGIAALNQRLPHYQRIHSFALLPEGKIEKGCITANGKLRRDAITERCRTEIDSLYAGAPA
jgi:long-chain acyl-CoA synthetase